MGTVRCACFQGEGEAARAGGGVDQGVQPRQVQPAGNYCTPCVTVKHVTSPSRALRFKVFSHVYISCQVSFCLNLIYLHLNKYIKMYTHYEFPLRCCCSVSSFFDCWVYIYIIYQGWKLSAISQIYAILTVLQFRSTVSVYNMRRCKIYAIFYIYRLILNKILFIMTIG